MEIVYLNGVKLLAGGSSNNDYFSVSGGSSTTYVGDDNPATHIYFHTAPTNTHVISVVAWGASSNALAVPTTGGAFSGAVTFNTGLTVAGAWTAASQTCADLGTVTTVDINGGTIDGCTITGALGGNASTATALETSRTIGGVGFNGTAAIDLPGVNTSGNQDTSGNAATANLLAASRNINGVSFNGGGSITVTAAADTLTATTLKSTVVTSSLTSVGTLGALTVTGAIAGGTINGTEIVTSATNNLGIGVDVLNTIGTGDYNVAFGDRALYDLDTGITNTAIGYNSAQNTTEGDENTVVGYQALNTNISGDANVAVGSLSLHLCSTGGFNAALGTSALYNTTGSNNTAIGKSAGDNITSGSSNIMIGANVDAVSATASNQLNIGNTIYGDISSDSIGIATSAPQDIASASNYITGSGLNIKETDAAKRAQFTVQGGGGAVLNLVDLGGGTDDKWLRLNTDGGVAVWQSLKDDSSQYVKNDILVMDLGSGNCEFGYGLTVGTINGMSAGEDGNENLWLGTNALNALAAGGLGNTAVGVGAMQYDATGDYNTAFGNAALNKNTLDHNTAVGYLACYRNTGEGNTAVGSLALRMHTSTNDGSFNTAVGADALKDVKSGVGNAGLGVGAGTSYSPSGKIENQDNIICLGDNDITYLYCNVDLTYTSDGRDKTDVEDFTAGLDWIEAMRPITYHWDKRSWYTERDKETDEIISQTEPDGTHKKDKKNIGFIAQEVLEIEKVHGFGNNRDDMLTVDLTGDGSNYGMKNAALIPVLVNAIKELSTKVKALEAA
jgi:hypothetical protein